MQTHLARLFAALTSFKLAVFILLGLFVATWLGTIAQAKIGLYQAQRKYFESFFYFGPEEPLFGFLRFPLPGGLLLMALLAVNLIAGGIIRVRWTLGRAGILLMHFGVVMLLVAGWARWAYAEEGAIGLLEGQRGAEYTSYFESEIALAEIGAEGVVREWLVPDRVIHVGGAVCRASFSGLPLRLEITSFVENADVLPKGPMFAAPSPVLDGYFVQPAAPEAQAEANLPACYATVIAEGASPQQGILWMGARAPWTVRVGERVFTLELRKRRYPLPFEIELVKFTHEYHPGTDMPRHFQSDVIVRDSSGVPQPLLIRMNEPLRRDGFVAYQSSFRENPAEPTRLYSELAVVRNPADQWPLYSLIVMTLGMFIHFVAKLFRWIARETAKPQTELAR